MIHAKEKEKRIQEEEEKDYDVHDLTKQANTLCLLLSSLVRSANGHLRILLFFGETV